MKVVFVNQADHGGGAAIAAYRLFQGVVSAHPQSRFVVENKQSGNPRVIGPKTRSRRLWVLLKPERERLPLLWYKNRTEHIFSPSLNRNHYLVNVINELKPDVVHLHWVQKGTLGIEDLAAIKAPVVWTLHDSWAFTGGCHLPYNCLKYQQKCGSCPHLNGRPGRDLSSRVLSKKIKAWDTLGITVVTPSRWLGEKARGSRVLGTKPVEVIPNGLDLDVFKPLAKGIAKEILNLDQAKRYLVFGAIEATSDSNKGFDLLREALVQFSRDGRSSDVEALILGANEPAHPVDLGIPVHYLGRVNDEVHMVVALSAASAVLVPSRSENLPNMVAEGLACGVPGLTFNVGGCADLIDHKTNGFLAEPFVIDSYVEGLVWILDQDEAELSAQARSKAQDFLALDKVTARYLALYQGVLHPEETP